MSVPKKKQSTTQMPRRVGDIAKKIGLPTRALLIWLEAQGLVGMSGFSEVKIGLAQTILEQFGPGATGMTLDVVGVEKAPEISMDGGTDNALVLRKKAKKKVQDVVVVFASSSAESKVKKKGRKTKKRGRSLHAPSGRKKKIRIFSGSKTRKPGSHRA